jgi:hypothetical protein
MKNQSAARVAFLPEPEELGNEGKFSYAEDVHKVAARVIDKWHDGLAEAKIVYLFKNLDSMEKWTSKGKMVMAKTYKAPEQWRFLAECDILVIVNKKAWDFMQPKQREALIDHELCHIVKDWDKDGNPKYILITHDVEEFAAVIQRHGLWTGDIKTFFTAAQQMTIEVLEK